ncbi:hypothetical protein CVT26_003607 [Gymnopilus dilepis]|uniref:Uncharacterized protein n=1 Tax=Gymnopilus dilepis TaxID=231916 RepID=A0A409X194_9AGAR|nr:hypothetical protein CVT26_003607 [Gymnopilus dilepis]
MSSCAGAVGARWRVCTLQPFPPARIRVSWKERPPCSWHALHERHTLPVFACHWSEPASKTGCALARSRKVNGSCKDEDRNCQPSSTGSPAGRCGWLPEYRSRRLEVEALRADAPMTVPRAKGVAALQRLHVTAPVHRRRRGGGRRGAPRGRRGLVSGRRGRHSALHVAAPGGAQIVLLACSIPRRSLASARWSWGEWAGAGLVVNLVSANEGNVGGCARLYDSASSVEDGAKEREGGGRWKRASFDS